MTIINALETSNVTNKIINKIYQSQFNVVNLFTNSSYPSKISSF